MYMFVAKQASRVKTDPPNEIMETALATFLAPYAEDHLYNYFKPILLDVTYHQVYATHAWAEAARVWAAKFLAEAQEAFPMFTPDYLAQTLCLTWTANDITLGRPFYFGDGNSMTKSLQDILKGV